MVCKAPTKRVLIGLGVGCIVFLVSIASFRNEKILQQIGAWTEREHSNEGEPYYENPAESSQGLIEDSIPLSQVNGSLGVLSRLMRERLSLPNDAEKIIYSKSCDARSKSLLACTETSCKHPISNDSEERLQNVMTTRSLRLSDAYRDLIWSIGQSIPQSDYIFVSAVSSNHYYEMQAMFYGLHNTVMPNIKNASIVLFDIGLSDEEKKRTEKKCNCTVVTFPKEKFPTHVADNHCYSWKPIIILATIRRARKLVIWQDSSIRWSTKFQVILDRAEKYGQQIIRYKDSSRVPANTLKQTFTYMQDDTCKYMPYPEVQGSVHIHKNDPVVIQGVIEPWVRCALEAACICPVQPGTVLACKKGITLHRCHRFDQSAFTIMLARLYGQDMYKFMAPEYSFLEPQYVSIKRGNKMPSYFIEKEIPKSSS